MNDRWTVQLPGRALAVLCLAMLFCNCAVAADPQIVAHRGAALESPENTIPAIDRAIALGQLSLRSICDTLPMVKSYLCMMRRSIALQMDRVSFRV